MVLYFPVTALVTLFGHILQNPLDPRARSDTKLLNVVVNFLSMLGHEAETGGVHAPDVVNPVVDEYDRNFLDEPVVELDVVDDRLLDEFCAGRIGDDLHHNLAGGIAQVTTRFRHQSDSRARAHIAQPMRRGSNPPREGCLD